MIPNFKHAINKLKRVGEKVKEFNDDFSRSEAELFLKKIRDHIDAQDLPWKPLSPSYLEYKNRFGLSTKIWMSTGELYRSLEIFKDKNNKYYVGAPVDTVHSDTDILINDIIKFMEYGTKNIPARPLFTPVRSYMSMTRPFRYVNNTKKVFVKWLKSDKDDLDRITDNST